MLTIIVKKNVGTYSQFFKKIKELGIVTKMKQGTQLKSQQESFAFNYK